MSRGTSGQGGLSDRQVAKQLLTGLVSLAVVVSFASAGVGTVTAATSTNTLYVDDSLNCPGEPCYESIQYAVDNTTSGSAVVHVEPGTYEESVTVDTANITIVGAPGNEDAGPGANAPVLDGNGSSAIAFTVTAGTSNVTIQGFEIREYSQIGVFVNNQQSTSKIDNVTVTDTSISGPLYGIAAFAKGDGADIRDLTLSRNDIVPGGYISVITAAQNNGSVVDATIAENRIHDGSGIGIQTDSYGNQSLVENIEITGNTVTSLTDEGIIINTEDASTSRNIDVERNVARDDDNGVRIKHQDNATVSSVDVNYNELTSNDNNGVLVENGIDNAEVELSYNTITENTNYGVSNNDGSILNADNNWWGDASGPYHPSANPSGQGDNVSGNVDFKPWFTRSVELSSGTAEPGDTVTVQFRADAADVAGYQTNISFNSSVVEVQSVDGGDLGSPTTNLDNDEGWVRITSAQASGVNTPLLAEVTFKIVGETGEESPVTVSESETAMFDQGGHAIGSPTFSSGTVAAYDNGSGDVNGDGNVDAGDVVLVQRYIVGQDVDIDTNAADVNGDGTVDASDALLIEQRIVGA